MLAFAFKLIAGIATAVAAVGIILQILMIVTGLALANPLLAYGVGFASAISYCLGAFALSVLPD